MFANFTQCPRLNFQTFASSGRKGWRQLRTATPFPWSTESLKSSSQFDVLVSVCLPYWFYFRDVFGASLPCSCHHLLHALTCYPTEWLASSLLNCTKFTRSLLKLQLFNIPSRWSALGDLDILFKTVCNITMLWSEYAVLVTCWYRVNKMQIESNYRW